MSPALLSRGELLGDGLNLQRWQVLRKIGEGQFAEVYEVADTFQEGRRVALKIDRTLEVKTVRQEQKTLKRLQACSCVVRLLEQGVHEERYFIVMELLGLNVADARKASAPEGRWDPSTAASIGRHLLDALSGMHGLGFIHRDVKPANFAITPRSAAPKDGSWHVIDFGLARRYVDDGGMVLPPRTDAAFRGSTTYASLAAHEGEDLGRRDDLWSWLYVVVEMVCGTLPWRSDSSAPRDATRDKELAVKLKRECMEAPEQLVAGGQLPEALLKVCRHLAGLAFEAAPDYGLLRCCLQELASMEHIHQIDAATEAALSAELDTPMSPVAEALETPLSPPQLQPSPASPPQAQRPPPLPPPRPQWTAPPQLSPPSTHPGAPPDRHITLNGGMDVPPLPTPPPHQPSAPPAHTPSSPTAAPTHHHSHSRSRSCSVGPSRHHQSPERDLINNRGSSVGYVSGRPAHDRRRDRRDSRDRDSEHRRGRRRDVDWERENHGSRHHGSGIAQSAAGNGSGRQRSRSPVDNRAPTSERDGSRHCPVSACPSNGVNSHEDILLDVSRCRQVRKYSSRIKQGNASAEALAAKKALGKIPLTEGLGLAAYLIDDLVSAVIPKDAQQMAELLSELQEFTYLQRQRAKEKAQSYSNRR